ncbi:hypothetical protein ABT063_07065 [Streptomyces sp. NPDC002838]|uniref:hypothetical protein n=1 Tax=Streptomyces sp. NPDC002838 TaxID=3154436 RepID=UPI0033212E63
MPKKRSPGTGKTGFAEVIASMQPVETGEGNLVPSPATAGEFVDEQGCLWTKSRGPLDPRSAKRLVRTADDMIIGEGAGDVLRSVPHDDRQAAWANIEDRLDSSELHTYQAYEFASANGRTLVYFEEFC